MARSKKSRSKRSTSTSSGTSLGDASTGGSTQTSGTGEEEEETILYICRHGQDVYNKIQSETFQDPMTFDAPLTSLGLKQSRALGRWMERNAPDIELVVTSPLTRTLQTTATAFAYLPPEVPRITEPRIAERCYASHDLGTSPRKLAKIFPQFDFGHLEEVWWYTGDGHHKFSRDPEYRECTDTYERFTRWRYHEPIFLLDKRLQKFKGWLRNRPEKKIAIVCHASVIRSLTGSRRTSNCGIVKIPVSELMRNPEEERRCIDVRGLSSSSGSGFFSNLESSSSDDKAAGLFADVVTQSSTDSDDPYESDFAPFVEEGSEGTGEFIVGVDVNDQEYISEAVAFRKKGAR